MSTRMSSKETNKLIEELFNEDFQQEAWLKSAEPNIFDQASPSPVAAHGQIAKEIEEEKRSILQDINFFRDLGPLSRNLNLVDKRPKNKEFQNQRAFQKKVVNNIVDFESTVKTGSCDEIFKQILCG